MSYLRLIEAPTEEPLDVAEVRDLHLRVTNGSAEDAYIDRLIRASRHAAERLTGRALMTQRWAQVMSAFTCEIALMMPPCQAVESITYVDEDGTTQTLDPSLYQVLGADTPSAPKAPRALIRPAFDMVWPATRVQLEAVTVTFRCGYVDGGSPPQSAVPEDITQGMLIMIAEMYKQRSESVHTIAQHPALVRARNLWLDYRVY